MLLIFLTLLAISSACTTLDELSDLSYADCLLLPECRDAFYLSTAPPTYEQERFRVLFGILWHELDGALTFTQICNTTDSFAVWMQLLSFYEFCDENEIYTEWAGGCVCESSKHCTKLTHPGFGIDAAWLWVLQIIILLVVCWVSYQLLGQLTKPKRI